MNMVQVKNGQIVAYGLPETGTLSDGSTVSGYNLLPNLVLKSEGWLPLIDEQPTYDEATHHIEHDGYLIESDKVTSKYKVVENQPPVPTMTTEERISFLEDALNAILGGL